MRAVGGSNDELTGIVDKSGGNEGLFER